MIKKDTLTHIAHLARLPLSEEEHEKMYDDFSAVLRYVTNLEKLDLEGVEPFVYPVHRTTVTRRDIPARYDGAGRPEGYLKVPAILKRGGSSITA